MARLARGRCVAALFVLFVTAAVGKADMIQWSYQSGAGPNNNLIISMGDGLPRTLVLIDGVGRTTEHDSTNVTVVRLLTTGPRVNLHNASTTLGLTVFDSASHTQHTFMFPVVFNGTADLPSHTSSVALTFPGGTSQSFVLGGHQYTVTIGQIQPLIVSSLRANFPGANPFLGLVEAEVRVGPESAAASPEPSTLILAGMGLLTAAGAAGALAVDRQLTQ